MTSGSLAVTAIDTPVTVADARRWLRGVISWAPSELRELAELVLSELVTNAVLHAPGPLRVSVSRREGCLALEVVDTNPDHLPAIRSYADDATTGRGLRIVDRLCAAWGVRGLAAGKGVWAVLADPGEPGAHRRSADRFSPGTWLLDDPTRALAATAPPAGPAELVPVRVLGVPLPVYLAAQEHDDALLRELRLLPAGGAVQVPRRLLALAEETRRRFATEGTTVRGQVAAAVADGAATVDLDLSVPRTSWELLGRLAAQLDEADAYCERGDLLTLPSPPVVRELRAWYLDQVRLQLEGGDPSPWPGPGAARVDPDGPGRKGAGR